MRLGWDDQSKNAPELASLAEAEGAAAITIHGRTRQQLYGGAADWAAVRAVKDAVRVPVIVNGDVVDDGSAVEALEQSGSDGVMLGRGAIGQPWLARSIEGSLGGRPAIAPTMIERLGIILQHLARAVDFYGESVGVRVFRKHLAAYIDKCPRSASTETKRNARAHLCRLETARDIEAGLVALWSHPAYRFPA